MIKASERDDSSDQSGQLPYRVRLPGFITDEEIGLGDVVKRATSYLGIAPCGGCEQRAAALNRWMVFTNGHRRSGTFVNADSFPRSLRSLALGKRRHR